MKRPSLLAKRILINCSVLRKIARLMLIAPLVYGNNKALAQQDNWQPSSGSSWFQSSNWSSGVPTANNDVAVETNSVAFIQGTNAAHANSLTIDNGGVAVGNITSGTLNVNGTIAVGTAGTSGSFSLNYGFVSCNTLAIGASSSYSDTSYGILDLTGNDPTIEMAGGVTVTMNSQIIGTNGLNKNGLGTLILNGNNNYSGGTTIDIGTLQVGNGGTSGNLGYGDVTDNGTLAFDRSDTINVTNQISGTGNLVQEGSGTTILTANNTYSGGTTISNGVLQVGDGGTSGTLGSGNVTNDSELAFDRSDSVVISNAISGTGSLWQIGSGTTILAGNNTYSGGTSITNGILQVGDGGTSGSLGSGNVTNDSELAFDRSDSTIVSNQISGTGSVSQIGSGTTILTGANTYSGYTTISNGTLQVGDGGTNGSLGTNNVYDYGSLVFDLASNTIVNNVISGTGRLVQDGPGTNSILTLTASNTYSGGTFIENGSTIAVSNGWALGTGDVNVNNGTLEACATAVTNRTIINVGGNYTQSGEGNLQLTIGGIISNAGTNEYDQLKISGSANLNGTLWLIPTNGYVPQHEDELTLITAAGGVSGSFSSISNEISYSPLLDPQLIYNQNDVVLEWEQLSFVNYLTVSNNVKLTRNQMAVAKAVDSIGNSKATNNVKLVDYLDSLSNLTNELPAAFTQISPDQLNSMIMGAFAVMDVQGDEFLKRADELRTDYQSMYDAKWRHMAVSANAFDKYVDKTWDLYWDLPINVVNIQGDENSAGYSLVTSGVTVGGDGRLNDHTYAGLALGYMGTGAGLENGGSMSLSTFDTELYSAWFDQGFYLEGMIGADINSYSTKREAIEGVANGRASGFGWTGLLGGGYDYKNGPWAIGPRLDAQYLSANAGSFTENGSISPLHIFSQNADDFHTQFSIDLHYHYLAGRWTYITPEFSLGWRHDFMTSPLPVKAQFASGQGNAFTVYGPKLGSDSAVSTLGLSVQWTPAFNTFINLTLQLGRSGYNAENINLGMRFYF